MVLEVVPEDPQGVNWDRLVLQWETLWLERLSANTALGLNEVLA